MLTPWRVVNMHMSDTIGGYCFFDEDFDQNKPLDEPRLVDNGDVTANVFCNPDAHLLEMNSKSRTVSALSGVQYVFSEPLKA